MDALGRTREFPTALARPPHPRSGHDQPPAGGRRAGGPAFDLTPEQALAAPDNHFDSVQQFAGHLHFVRLGLVVARLAGGSRAGPSRTKDAACPIAADRAR
jgi:hypothetical protein